MGLVILEPDSKLANVVYVSVPSIYANKTAILPKRMARLVQSAAESLQKVYQQIEGEGGHLYISDMYRSASEQQRAHEDWKAGRKTAFSPPACSGVHEAARAIDIDAFDTVIGHKKVREVLNGYGWINITDSLTGPECWHYEFRERYWEEYKQQHGYSAMAHAMKLEIGNTVGRAAAEVRKEEVRWLQGSLNSIMGLTLQEDGLYGPKTKEAVTLFQEKYGLQVDGVAGPITIQRIRTLMEAT